MPVLDNGLDGYDDNNDSYYNVLTAINRSDGSWAVVNLLSTTGRVLTQTFKASPTLLSGDVSGRRVELLSSNAITLTFDSTFTGYSASNLDGSIGVYRLEFANPDPSPFFYFGAITVQWQTANWTDDTYSALDYSDVLSYTYDAPGSATGDNGYVYEQVPGTSDPVEFYFGSTVELLSFTGTDGLIVQTDYTAIISPGGNGVEEFGYEVYRTTVTTRRVNMTTGAVESPIQLYTQTVPQGTINGQGAIPSSWNLYSPGTNLYLPGTAVLMGFYNLEYSESNPNGTVTSLQFLDTATGEPAGGILPEDSALIDERVNLPSSDLLSGLSFVPHGHVGDSWYGYCYDTGILFVWTYDGAVSISHEANSSFLSAADEPWLTSLGPATPSTNFGNPSYNYSWAASVAIWPAYEGPTAPFVILSYPYPLDEGVYESTTFTNNGLVLSTPETTSYTSSVVVIDSALTPSSELFTPDYEAVEMGFTLTGTLVIPNANGEWLAVQCNVSPGALPFQYSWCGAVTKLNTLGPGGLLSRVSVVGQPDGLRVREPKIHLHLGTAVPTNTALRAQSPFGN
jgi:hypothetical protein